MFYSHQLLARKAPLGQIWMAATLHAKINRKKLNKLDLVQICEEILNPAVPMALRLSAILMGGVVIVYERKVKILYDDVQRLLVEINEAWKVKSITDRNCLPRGKFQAKYEAVTLPDHVDEMEIGVGDGSDYRYFSMRLDQVEVPVINDGGDGDETSIYHHQAELVDITLLDHFDSYQMDANLYNRFQRFDIEEDEDTELISSSIREKSPVPVTLVASPPHLENSPGPVTLVSSTPLQKEPQPATDIQEQYPEPQVTEDALQPQQNEHVCGPRKQRKRKEAKCFFMDYEQTIIPGHIYESWLENPSDITLTKGKRKKVDLNATMKTSHLMELPPVALCGLLEDGNKEVHYPAPLTELWQTRNQLPTTNASMSGRTSSTLLPEQVLPPSTTHDQNPMEFPLEGDPPSQEGVEPFEVPMENPGDNLNNMPRDVSSEKLSSNHVNNGFPWKVSIGTPAINLVNFEMPINEANLFATPGNSGDNIGTIPSSGSGHDFQINNEEFQLRRLSSRKRPYSSSHGRSNLESVAEEPSAPFEQGFKLPGVYEYSSTLDHEVLIETGPTPSQYPIVNSPVDKTTDFMRKHLKRHFDTPGVPQVESLNHLAFGMERHRAAQLFYQTCVLATHDFLRVEQTTPYGDIKISKGQKM